MSGKCTAFTEHERVEMIRAKNKHGRPNGCGRSIDGRIRVSKRSRRRGSYFRKRLLGISLICNVVLLIIMTYLVVTLIKQDHGGDTTDFCEEHKNVALKDNSKLQHGDIFCDLTLDEIRTVLQFLYTQSSLNLVTPDKANLSTNFIYSIELYLPSKSSVINYIDNAGLKPLRKAKVVIFNGKTSNRSVDEYIVGPLDHLSVMRLRKHPFSTSASYRVRQVTFVEIWGVYELLLSMGELHKILEESYGATVFDCIKQGTQKCLVAHKTNLPISYSAERKTWISFYYDLEYFTLHPLDFQFLLNIDSIDTSKWRIEKIWYSNHLYNSFEEFLAGYNNGSINKTTRNFPSHKERQFGSLRLQSIGRLEFPQRAPKQFEPDGKRYHIYQQTVKYLNWHFSWQNSLMRGPSLFDIKFKEERVVYELGLQDIIVLYTGNNPAFARASYADGLNGLSSRTAGLVPGIDCPDHAIFRDITITTEDFPMGGIIPNAICIFEHNLGIPLRRHHSSIPGQGGLFYGGLVATSLVFRTIFVLNNYDYILDYILYENGAIEVKVHSTGYLLTTFQFPEEKEYGYQVGKDASAPMHLHLFNFKVDVDILGTKNRYKTIDINVEEIGSNENQNSGHHFKLQHNIKRTELEAACQYNFSSPKYHIFYNEEKLNKYGNHRGYRIEANGFVQQLLPQNIGFEDTISWSRYQMAVTKRKNTEPSSSSIHATFDAGEPVVDFSKFVKDNEAIIDEDIVAWLTLGTYHIPHTEDMPNVVTAGKELSFLLTPFNYFSEDPSVKSRDSVRISPKDSSSSAKGLNIEGNIKNYTCIPKQYDYNTLKKNGSSIFFSFS